MASVQTPTAFGRYVLLEKIAVGGMAEIFKAQYRADQDFEKVLVIKRILPHLANNDEFITMFRDEAKVNVRLTHANIVQVFDFGREANDYYLAMEYVQGQNLRRVLKRSAEMGSPSLPVPLALYIAQECAKGLAYAHTRKDGAHRDLNIIHRDVTPSNILVSYEGEVKITDFGIAKAASKTGSTQQGMVKGKAPYLAPEQLQTGRTVDARLDVFALGAVTWEMLTGQRLVPGDTDMEILGHLLTGGPFPPPSALKSSIPPEVDRVVMRALERDPDQRYPGAAAYQKELSVLVSRFAMTSTECAAWMAKLFAAEIEAEQSLSLAMPVIDAGAVTAGVEQEATRTRRSQTGPGAEDTASRQLRAMAATSDAPTRFVTPSEPLEAPLPERARKEPPRAPSRRRGAPAIVLGIALVGAIVAAAALLPPWRAATSIGAPAATPTSLALAPSPSPAQTVATASPVPSPAPTATAQATATAVSTRVRVKPTPTRPPATPAPTPTAVAVVGVGTISVDSSCNGSPCSGKIFVDGRETERETPAFDMEVPAGKRTIRIYNELQRMEATVTVTIEPNGAKRLGVVKLAPRR